MTFYKHDKSCLLQGVNRVSRRAIGTAATFMTLFALTTGLAGLPAAEAKETLVFGAYTSEKPLAMVRQLRPSLNAIADTLRRSSRFDEAESHFHEALALVETQDDREGVAIYTGNLAELALDRERWPEAEKRAREALPLAEKVGQMNQVNASDDEINDHLREAIAAGRVGSVLNQVDVDAINELQRIAVQESRLGIPLMVGRDVIHGFKTVMPIPLGQAATWNPEIVRAGARVAAREAATAGINWTFAPMIDISRDPRWGRIAESLGEDPYLASGLGAAMVEGFQGEDLADNSTIAATAKHFAGYGAAESGRDYATTNVPENELRNVYLRPFKAAVDAGVRISAGDTKVVRRGEGGGIYLATTGVGVRLPGVSPAMHRIQDNDMTGPASDIRSPRRPNSSRASITAVP